MTAPPPGPGSPLLAQFPELEPLLPFHPLVQRPTPVEPLEGFPGTRLLVKRDDLTSPLYGGNKARKFEFILGRALGEGCRELWTAGGLCSNHCTATAIYGRDAGLGVRLFLMATPLDTSEADLLRLQTFLGAELYLLSSGAMLRTMFERRPGILAVPPGGSSAEGVMGYVDAGIELVRQIRAEEVPAPDVIYIATASRGTVMGLSMGLALGALHPRIVAVETVDRRWQASRSLLPAPARAHHLLASASVRLARALPPLRQLQPDVDRRFERITLGAADTRVEKAMVRGWELGGLRLDAHFSGKAFAALLEELESGRLLGKTVLFWHTHGQVPEPLLAQALAANVSLDPRIASAVERSLRA